MKKETRHSSHTITRLSAHVVWITKYRYKVLDGELRLRCQELIKQTCQEFDVEIISGVIAKDHIHMLIEYPPKLALSTLIKNIKGRSSRILQKDFPYLGKRYWGQKFWAVGFGAWSVGDGSEEQVKLYLQHHDPNQKNGTGGFIFED